MVEQLLKKRKNGVDQRALIEERAIESKKHEEDDSLKDTLEVKFEHELEHLREKLFHEEDTVLNPQFMNSTDAKPDTEKQTTNDREQKHQENEEGGIVDTIVQKLSDWYSAFAYYL